MSDRSIGITGCGFRSRFTTSLDSRDGAIPASFPMVENNNLPRGCVNPSWNPTKMSPSSTVARGVAQLATGMVVFMLIAFANSLRMEAALAELSATVEPEQDDVDFVDLAGLWRFPPPYLFNYPPAEEDVFESDFASTEEEDAEPDQVEEVELRPKRPRISVTTRPKLPSPTKIPKPKLRPPRLSDTTVLVTGKRQSTRATTILNTKELQSKLRDSILQRVRLQFLLYIRIPMPPSLQLRNPKNQVKTATAPNTASSNSPVQWNNPTSKPTKTTSLPKKKNVQRQLRSNASSLPDRNSLGFRKLLWRRIKIP